MVPKDKSSRQRHKALPPNPTQRSNNSHNPKSSRRRLRALSPNLLQRSNNSHHPKRSSRQRLRALPPNLLQRNSNSRQPKQKTWSALKQNSPEETLFGLPKSSPLQLRYRLSMSKLASTPRKIRDTTTSTNTSTTRSTSDDTGHNRASRSLSPGCFPTSFSSPLIPIALSINGAKAWRAGLSYHWSTYHQSMHTLRGRISCAGGRQCFWLDVSATLDVI